MKKTKIIKIYKQQLLTKGWKKMSSAKINGIVLSESNLGDFDKMLTILTPNMRKNFVCG